LSEAGHCGLIRLHALGGRRHVALRWYRQLEDRLRVELGVAPGDEARRLLDEIRAGGFVAEGSPLEDAIQGGAAAEARLEEERKLVTIAVVELILVGGARGRDSGAGKAAADPERIRSALDAATTRDVCDLGARGELRRVAGTAPLSAHRVLAARRSATRRHPPLPMVGRDAQLDAVLEAFGDVAVSGRPHLLILVGNAGIGKSRL